MKRYVSVCGSSEAGQRELDYAEQVGKLLAEAGAIVICGGLGGVMDAAARGATSAGGIAVGLLPDFDRHGASEHLTIALPLGMGEARNALVARTADVLIAIGGEWGTLSEIALGKKMGKTVIGLNTWEPRRDGIPIEGIVSADSPEEAVRLALETRS